MNPTTPSPLLRLFAATLVSVITITLSALAMHVPTQTQSPVTLKSIHTDRAVTLYADHRPNCAWFVEMVLPTGDVKVAGTRPSCAWFVEMVLPTPDSRQMTENLQSVVATL
jgi:hypothetical protein